MNRAQSGCSIASPEDLKDAIVKPIDQLDFGFADAQQYLKPGSGALLEKYFVADENLDLLTKPETYFLIGEKGTGKTAYTAYLSNFSYANINGHAVFINSDDYLLFRRYVQDCDLNPEDYFPAWEAILLAIAFQRVVCGDDFRVDTPHAYNAGMAILNEFDLHATAPFGEFLELLIAATDAISIANKALTTEPEAPQYAARGNYRRMIKSLRKIFTKAISSVTPNRNHVIFIDGLDVRPPKVPHNEYEMIVSSILNSIWRVNSEKLSLLPDRNIRFVALTRPEVLVCAGLHNLHTKIKDHGAVLDWKTSFKEYRYSKIFRLADRLLASQQDNINNVGLGGSWDQYFPYKLLRNRRPGDKRSTEEDSFIQALRISFYRPRDIVTILHILQERAIELNMGSLSEFDKALFSDFRVRERYSRHLISEVSDALEFYSSVDDLPLLQRFFLEFLDPHIEELTRQFTYDHFVAAYNIFVKHIISERAEIPVIFSSADRFLQTLYELNIIAFIMASDGRGRQRWCYNERSHANIQPQVSPHCWYKVHLGIARALNPARFG